MVSRASQQIVPEGYKRTEAGIVPEDWSIKRIGDLSKVIRGASPRPKGDKRYYGGKVPRLMVQDVTRDGMFVTPQIDFLTEAGAKLSRPCSKGTLTLVCSGTVGVPAILAVDACIHDGFLALIRLAKGVDRDYLYQFFRTQQEKFHNSATHGGVFTNLTSDGVRDFLVPVPPNLPEQTAIANALSDVDVLIRSLEKLIAKKRAMKTAAMQQLLTGKKRLPPFDQSHTDTKLTELGEIPEDWELSTIGHVSNWSSGGTPNRSREDYWDGSIPWVSGSTLKSLRIFTSDQFLTEAGVDSGSKLAPVNSTLLLVRGSALHSRIRAGLVTASVAFNQDVKCLFPTNQVIPEYLTLYILSMEGELLKLVSSAGNSAGVLDTALVKSFPFPRPSKQEQRAIATALFDLDAELDSIKNRLTKTQQLKQGMMQELLTGRTRLI